MKRFKKRWLSPVLALCVVLVPVAAWAVTFTIEHVSVMGNFRFVSGYIALDSSYPTGGETMTPENIGLDNIHFIVVQNQDGYVFNYDYNDSKLMAYQLPDTTSLGGTSAYNDSIPMAEVQANEDLSGVDSVRFGAWGN